MTDIENTTISVRSFAVSMWTVIAALLTCAVLGTAGWMRMSGAVEKLTTDQVQIKEALQDRNIIVDAKFSSHDTKFDTISGKLDTIISSLDEDKRATDELVKSKGEYRPFKWSTPMQIRNNEQLEELNPQLHLKAPDAQQIHDQLIPYTP